MNISQALRAIKKIKGEIAENLTRAQDGVTFKKSAPPAFDFQICMEKVAVLVKDLVQLESRVAITNAEVVITFKGSAITLVQAIHLLRELKGEIAWLTGLKAHVRNQESSMETSSTYDYDTEKHRQVEVEYLCRLPEAKRASLVSEAKKRFDEINDLVETANHQTVLKETRPLPA